MKHDKVDRKGPGWVYSEKGNVCRTRFATNGNLSLAADAHLSEDHCECISYGIVPLHELVLLAAKQVVSKGVEGFAAQWARCTAVTLNNFDSKPPPQKEAVLGSPKLHTHAFLWHSLHPRCSVGH